MLLLSKLKADQLKFTDYRYRYCHSYIQIPRKVFVIASYFLLDVLLLSINRSLTERKCQFFQLWVICSKCRDRRKAAR